MGRSDEKRNWLTGKSYTQHYDDRGRETGRSETRSDVFTGRSYTQHYDAGGERSGRSDTKADWFDGRTYSEHSHDGQVTGRSQTESDWFTSERYQQHYDADGGKQGCSHADADWATGRAYTQHYGANPSAGGASAVGNPVSGGGGHPSRRYTGTERSDGSEGNSLLAVLVVICFLGFGHLFVSSYATERSRVEGNGSDSVATQVVPIPTAEPDFHGYEPLGSDALASCIEAAARTNSALAKDICENPELLELNQQNQALIEEWISVRGEKYRASIETSRAATEGGLATCGAFGPKLKCIHGYLTSTNAGLRTLIAESRRSAARTSEADAAQVGPTVVEAT